VLTLTIPEVLLTHATTYIAPATIPKCKEIKKKSTHIKFKPHSFFESVLPELALSASYSSRKKSKDINFMKFWPPRIFASKQRMKKASTLLGPCKKFTF
jgi:hypothetical protein